MTKNLLHSYIRQSAIRYSDWMGVKNFPKFSIVEKEIDRSVADMKGFGSYAYHHFDISTGAHSIVVWSDIYKSKSNADYLLFHEFTHILDTEMYIQKDTLKCAMYKGFLEYHAGQIDFLKVLGAQKVNSYISFSMKKMVDAVDNSKTAEEYLISAHKTSTCLLKKNGFPVDMETLVTTVGLIFNYWGRRSICKMYAVDYVDKANNEAIEKWIGNEPYSVLDQFLTGWLTDTKITILGEFYLKMMTSKMKEYPFT